MAIPQSIKKLLPSLKVEGDESATVSVADFEALLPSLDLRDGTVGLSIADLRKILRIALSGVEVDEKWYLGQVPELRRDISQGKFSSVADHYYTHGYLEGRLPKRPIVDENYYLRAYPDVAAAIEAGRLENAFDHYVQNGYYEGRLPNQPAQSVPVKNR